MGRGLVYLLTMAGVVVTLGIILNVVCALFNVPIGGGNFVMIVVLSTFMGFAGSIIGLFLSKTIVKHQMKVQVITKPKNQAENWLVQTVALLAEKKGVEMPEVGIYDSDEMNAFATGWNKNKALVAVSSGLLQNMNQDEVEAVLAHEIGHVANGDMVTLALIQGVVNAFVMFFARIIGSFVDRTVFKNTSDSPGIGYFVTSIVMDILLGFLASAIVMWFSRLREFRADEMGAKLASKDKMISALDALRPSAQRPDQMPERGNLRQDAQNISFPFHQFSHNYQYF